MDYIKVQYIKCLYKMFDVFNVDAAAMQNDIGLPFKKVFVSKSLPWFDETKPCR